MLLARRSRGILIIALVLLGSLFLATPRLYAVAPTITAVGPGSGPTGGGTVVTILGSDFTGTTGVTFGGLPAGFVVDSDNQITATAPAFPFASAVDIIVTNGDGPSANTVADDFLYVQAALTVLESGGSTLVTEGGAVDTFTVALAVQPSGPVTVTLLGTAEVNVTPSILVFQTTDWFTPRVVTATAVDDGKVEGTHVAVITLGAAGGGFTGLAANVFVTITDNDARRILVSAVCASTMLLRVIS